MDKGIQEDTTYFRRLLTAVFEFMLLTGLSAETTAKTVNAALEAVSKQGRREASFARSSELVTACLVLDRWRRTRRYVDKLAQPRALPLFGPAPSIAALVKSERRRGVLKAKQLKSFGLVTHVGGGRYKPSAPSGVVSDLSPAFQYQVAHALFMLLRTIRMNMSVSDKTKRLVERFAEVPDLPIEHEQEFREFVKQQGSQLLWTINEWMESRRAMTSARGRRRSTLAGFHVYAYLGDEATLNR